MGNKIFYSRKQHIENSSIIGVHLGRVWWAGPKHVKKARPRHGTVQNNLVPGRHGPIYRAGFGPRSRPMGGHEHGPFKTGTKWPI
jgi:hypothetical protein